MQHRTTRTIALKGTSKKTAAHLDFASLAALQYAQAWAHSRAQRRAPLSLVLRRALAVYVRHLEAISGPELGEQSHALHEARALEAAANGRGATCPASGLMTEEDAQRLAAHRLAQLPALHPGDPWPEFAEVLYGAEVVAQSRADHLALEARVAGYMEAVAKTPQGRRAGLRRPASA